MKMNKINISTRLVLFAIDSTLRMLTNKCLFFENCGKQIANQQHAAAAVASARGWTCPSDSAKILFLGNVT